MKPTCKGIGRAGLSIVLGLAGLVAAGGCGGEKYPAPPGDLARDALERSLTAWREGGRPEAVAVAGSEPAVQVVDTVWQLGRKLGSFEILRDEAGEADHRFEVRLKLRGPDADEQARYVVLGQGPLWVYREEDYRKMLDMDNNPVPAKARKRRR